MIKILLLILIVISLVFIYHKYKYDEPEYVITWKSNITGYTCQGTSSFNKQEAIDICNHMDRLYPYCTHSIKKIKRLKKRYLKS